MKLIVLPLIALLPSCNLYKSLSENSDLVRSSLTNVTAVIGDLKTKYDGIKEAYDKVVPMVKETMSAAKGAYDELAKDQDGDGDVDFDDLLIGLGGLGVTGGGIVAARNRSSAKAKEAERERARLAEAELDKRIAMLEVKS